MARLRVAVSAMELLQVGELTDVPLLLLADDGGGARVLDVSDVLARSEHVLPLPPDKWPMNLPSYDPRRVAQLVGPEFSGGGGGGSGSASGGRATPMDAASSRPRPLLPPSAAAAASTAPSGRRAPHLLPPIAIPHATGGGEGDSERPFNVADVALEADAVAGPASAGAGASTTPGGGGAGVRVRWSHGETREVVAFSSHTSAVTAIHAFQPPYTGAALPATPPQLAGWYATTCGSDGRVYLWRLADGMRVGELGNTPADEDLIALGKLARVEWLLPPQVPALEASKDSEAAALHAAIVAAAPASVPGGVATSRRGSHVARAPPPPPVSSGLDEGSSFLTSVAFEGGADEAGPTATAPTGADAGDAVAGEVHEDRPPWSVPEVVPSAAEQLASTTALARETRLAELLPAAGWRATVHGIIGRFGADGVAGVIAGRDDEVAAAEARTTVLQQAHPAAEVDIMEMDPAVIEKEYAVRNIVEAPDLVDGGGTRRTGRRAAEAVARAERVAALRAGADGRMRITRDSMAAVLGSAAPLTATARSFGAAAAAAVALAGFRVDGTEAEKAIGVTLRAVGLHDMATDAAAGTEFSATGGKIVPLDGESARALVAATGTHKAQMPKTIKKIQSYNTHLQALHAERAERTANSLPGARALALLEPPSRPTADGGASAHAAGTSAGTTGTGAGASAGGGTGRRRGSGAPVVKEVVLPPPPALTADFTARFYAAMAGSELPPPARRPPRPSATTSAAAPTVDSARVGSRAASAGAAPLSPASRFDRSMWSATSPPGSGVLSPRELPTERAAALYAAMQEAMAAVSPERPGRRPSAAAFSPAATGPPARASGGGALGSGDDAMGWVDDDDAATATAAAAPPMRSRAGSFAAAAAVASMVAAVASKTAAAATSGGEAPAPTPASAAPASADGGGERSTTPKGSAWRKLMLAQRATLSMLYGDGTEGPADGADGGAPAAGGGAVAAAGGAGRTGSRGLRGALRTLTRKQVAAEEPKVDLPDLPEPVPGEPVPAQFGPYALMEVVRVRELFDSCRSGDDDAAPLDSLKAHGTWDALMANAALQAGRQRLEAWQETRIGEAAFYDTVFYRLTPAALATTLAWTTPQALAAQRAKAEVDWRDILSPPLVAAYTAMFHDMDADKSGAVSVSEVRTAFEERIASGASAISGDDLAATMADYAADRELTLDEFLNMMAATMSSH